MEKSLVFVVLGTEDWGEEPRFQNASTCFLAAMFLFV